MHVFSEEQIEKTTGLEREYRVFWNKEAEKMCKNKAIREKLQNKTAIQGAISSAWVLHKTSLLQLEAEKLFVEVQHMFKERDDAAKEEMLRSTKKNLDKMLDIQKTIEGSRESTNAEVTIKEELTKLKIAQEALSKAISRQKRAMNAVKERIQYSILHTAMEPEEFTESELQEMIQDIRCEEVPPLS